MEESAKVHALLDHTIQLGVKGTDAKRLNIQENTISAFRLRIPEVLCGHSTTIAAVGQKYVILLFPRGHFVVLHIELKILKNRSAYAALDIGFLSYVNPTEQAR